MFTTVAVVCGLGGGFENRFVTIVDCYRKSPMSSILTRPDDLFFRSSEIFRHPWWQLLAAVFWRFGLTPRLATFGDLFWRLAAPNTWQVCTQKHPEM